MSRVLDTDPTSISPGTFLAYAKDGLLAPIAGERYWNREKRKERIEKILAGGKGGSRALNRAQLFQWTEFDERICELPAEDRVEDRMYEGEVWCEHLDEYAPEAYAAIKPRIAQLYKQKLLPDEFYQDEYHNAPLDFMCKRVLRNFILDASICGSDVSQAT